MKFETLTVHAGVEPDPATGSIMTPIYQTSTYVQEAPGKHKGYEYGRTQNPTRTALEKSMAALESGTSGICFASGMAAMDAIIKLLKEGDEVLCSNDLYGGSFRLLRAIYSRFGIKSRFLDFTNMEAVREAITDDTRLLWIETPSNPMLQVIDIAQVAELGRSRGILTCVDNTFATPYLQRPLELGIDLVHHSATKYLGGHSDVILGVLATGREDLAEQLYFIQNASGAVPGPQDCFLTLRGIKTLHLRMERSCANALKVAQFLASRSDVHRVLYPGLEGHPQYDLTRRQMRAAGAMVSFDMKDGNVGEAMRVLSATKVFALAESLGGVESLIGHPATMTHASIPREERLKVGLTDSLIRLSIGIENAEDLIADLEQALG